MFYYNLISNLFCIISYWLITNDFSLSYQIYDTWSVVSDPTDVTLLLGLCKDEALNVVKKLNFSPSCEQMVSDDKRGSCNYVRAVMIGQRTNNEAL